MASTRIMVSVLAAMMIVPVLSVASASPVDGHSQSAPATQSAPSTAPPQTTAIKNTLDIPIGVAIDASETRGRASSLLLANFGQITAENGMKPEAWYDADAQFRFSPDAEALMNFARDNGLSVHGHTLVWHKQNPDWFFLDATGRPLSDRPDDRQFLRDRLRTHLFAVAETFRNVYGEFGTDGNPIVAFDVVNEAVADEPGTVGGLRISEWQRVLGEGYIDDAFRFADEAFNETFAVAGSDRPVTLFLNDYDTEKPEKRGRMHALVERLLARGVPIDGVGHQFHTSLATPVADLESALDGFGDLDVTQAVTELDVPVGVPVGEHALVEQGDYYRDAFRIFRDHSDQLFSVTIWGLTDDRSWRVSEGAPLIFTSGFDEKPAYFGVIDAREAPPPPTGGGGSTPLLGWAVLVAAVAGASALILRRRTRRVALLGSGSRPESGSASRSRSESRR